MGNIFLFMGRYPWPFILIPPIILIVLAIVGFTQDEIVEKNISNIWTSTSGQFYNDTLYEASLLPGTTGRQSVSTFSAMAVSRDGGNLFQQSRLDEINDRMKKLAEITVSDNRIFLSFSFPLQQYFLSTISILDSQVDYKGHTFIFQDTCWSNSVGIGTTYKFACFRLSPMDLFKESRWSLDESARLTWYNDLIYPQLIAPLLPRLGIVLEFCLSESKNTIGGDCDHDYKMRTDPQNAISNGEDASYAETLLFFDDIGSFEENHRCKICIETMYDSKMKSMLSDYTDLLDELFKSLDQDENASEELFEAVQSTGIVLDREMVEEFYLYYMARQVYAELGASGYISGYETFMSTPLASLCEDCPRNVTEAEASQALFNHADNAFSSHNTAGLPLPFWNEETGLLFDYRNGATLKPTGGSGLNLSGNFAKRGDSIDDMLKDPGMIWLLGKFMPMTSRKYVLCLLYHEKNRLRIPHCTFFISLS